MFFRFALAVLVLGLLSLAGAQDKTQDKTPPTAEKVKSITSSPDSENSKLVPPNSKIYIAPMANGFETYVSAGIVKKEVPVVLVNDKSKADFELTGVADTANPGWAKQIFMNSDASNENASISLTNLKTGQVVWAYSVHKGNSYKGKQSAGEACGKHLKEKIESKQ
jgi:hypothetical protein